VNLYPSWRINLLVFTLITGLVGGYFFRQTRQATRELQNHSRNHSEILAAVVELNIRNALLSKSSLEDIVAGSLENSSRFIHYLDAIEPFSSAELTAFSLESGLAGVKIVQAGSHTEVSGPIDWLPERSCSDFSGLEHLREQQLYLFSFLPANNGPNLSPPGCVLVGLSAQRIDATLEKISVERLLHMFDDLHDIAYVRIESVGSRDDKTNIAADQSYPEGVVRTILPMGDKQLVVALKTDRFSKRRVQMQKEFIIFISFLILFGAFSSWWLYRLQRQRLRDTRKFERRMARQHEDAALGRAATTITHELRNPLNAIGMGLQRLQLEAEELDAEQRTLLVSMRKAVDRTNSIISRLKQYSHSFEVERQDVHLANLITALLILYRPQCEEQNIDIELDLDQTCSVGGDATLLEQLFDNLLKNSVEAQAQGGFLKVTIKQIEKSCCVEIKNGGFSLSPEESRLLFEPYFTTKNKGTGLGLVISKKIVQAHKGHLDWHADFDRERIQFLIQLPMRSAKSKLLGQ